VPAQGKTKDVTRATSAEGGSSDELPILLVRAAKAMVDRLRAEHPDGGSSSMTVVHGLAARYLVDRDDVTTVELARHLGITKQSASEVVGVLERAGTVRRAPHPSDGRARVLLLTDHGAAKLAEGRRRWNELEDEWAALVGRAELDVVREALTAYLEVDQVRRGAEPVGGCAGS
jgi:DNA-binding MarR family transcriptional regulator